MAIPYATPKHFVLDSRPFLNVLLGVLGWLVIGIVVSVLVLIVLLLFVNSGVPWFLTSLLLIADLMFIFVLVRRSHMLGYAFLACLGIAVVAAVAVTLSQIYATTAPIHAVDGSPMPQSIAVMEKVTLGGSEEWITIRGKDVDKPVLIYLGIGGPGAGGFPASALTLTPLEESFVVVNWDQPGTGKSYDAAPISSLTLDKFVSDAHELTLMMRERFQEQKVYVLGLSWGTIVGIKLIQAYPELFHAYVGNGQMVNTTENDRIGYELALEYARELGDTKVVENLQRNGPPPYVGEGMAFKYALYNNVLFRHMDSPTLEMILVLVPQFTREYGLVDRVNFARGLLDSFPAIYPQLRDLDFEQQANVLDVPVYFLVGREDVNAVASLVERYYKTLQDPHKALIWLEGGHGATPEQLADVFTTRVLPETYPQP